MAVNHKSSIDELVREVDADPLFPQFMDDGDPDEREAAMWFNRVLFARCDGLWVYAPHISAGMRVEIGWACKQEIPVSFFDEDFQEISYEL